MRARSTPSSPGSSRRTTSRSPPRTDAESPPSSPGERCATPPKTLEGGRTSDRHVAAPDTGQRSLARARGRAAEDACRLPPRRPRPEGDASLLRARLLRQLQRPPRRRGRALVPHVRDPGGGPLDRDRRVAARAGRRAERLAAGVHGAPRAPVRVLHAGDAADGRGVPPREPGPDRRAGDPRGDQRRHLPLHRLPADRRGDPVRGGEVMTIEQLPAAARIATETALKEAGRRRWLGKSINRVEDPRFLRGEGRYIDDISLPGMAHAATVRSPHAHARIVSIDTSKAETLPGVIRVVTGADVAEHAAPLPSFGAGPIIQDLIAIEKVRHYGEAVAAVIA